MILKGKAWKFRDHVNTDDIIAAKYLTTTDPAELGKRCMETLDPEFVKKIAKGDIIVAGANFGCGSSREHAPIAIKGCSISCVIAKSFARIFFRNSINIGLPIMESKEASRDIEQGDELEIDIAKGTIRNVTKNKTYNASPFPKFMQDIVDKGGLLNYIKSKG
ncbi:MAG: 3-isopropylmalate dehydratase small subunit [Candidatus Omnitrophica bacterium]|nr:3-isopropylmalate dehydratase small subunit [Candidatus Omnitrophota bacterium]